MAITGSIDLETRQWIIYHSSPIASFFSETLTLNRFPAHVYLISFKGQEKPQVHVYSSLIGNFFQLYLTKLVTCNGRLGDLKRYMRLAEFSEMRVFHRVIILNLQP